MISIKFANPTLTVFFSSVFFYTLNSRIFLYVWWTTASVFSCNPNLILFPLCKALSWFGIQKSNAIDKQTCWTFLQELNNWSMTCLFLLYLLFPFKRKFLDSRRDFSAVDLCSLHGYWGELCDLSKAVIGRSRMRQVSHRTLRI